MTIKQLAYRGLPQLAVAVGATTHSPGISGVQIWSTTLSTILVWDGTQWQLPSHGTQQQGTVLAAPASQAGAPTFRTLVPQDIPLLNQNTTGTAGRIQILDTRAVDDQPQNKAFFSIQADFKNNNAVGTPPVNANSSYSHILTVAGWDQDGQGGWPAQVSFGDGLAIRKGTSATTWGPWRTLLHSNNFNTYSPTLTGTGATGTWSINITGNANTATYQTTAAVGTNNTTISTTAFVKNTQDIILSRGNNLVANGNGGLGTLYNWNTVTSVTSDVPTGAKQAFRSIYQGVQGNNSQTEQIPVDPNKKYYSSVAFKQLNAGVQARAYMYIAPVDGAGFNINPQHYMEQPNTRTTLALPLNNGDTTVTLTSAANWWNYTSDHRSSIIFWNWTDSFGKTWPPGTYSRYYWQSGQWAAGGISGNVITLKTPWTGGNFPAGHVVGNGSSGGMYMYPLAPYPVPNTWTTYAGELIGGIHTDITTSAVYSFPIATASVVVGTLTDYAATGGTSQILFANVYFSDVFTPTIDQLATPTSKAQNTVFAAPSNGIGVPQFRTLVAQDIPILNQNTTGSAGQVAWQGVSGKPTTMLGYGITDGVDTSSQQTLTNKTIRLYTQVINTNTTAVASGVYAIVANVILTLPANPTAGDWVTFTNRSGLTTCIIGCNGQNIMQTPGDMTLDILNIPLTLSFIDTTRGWTFI